MNTSTGTGIDYYRLLGVSSDATLEEIRAAYRGKVRLCHPDLVADESEDVRQAATEMTAQLNEAYQCLSDPHRRAAYDTDSRAQTPAAGRPSTGPLVVSPPTLRCEVTPGDTVRLTLNLRADSPPGGEGFQVRAAEPLVVVGFTVTSHTARRATLKVRMDTSKLAAHRIYDAPFLVTWGKLTGAATLKISTAELQNPDFTRGHWARPPRHRVRDVVTIVLGGIVLPLLVLAWALGLFPAPMPANPPLVAFICAGVVAATTWFLISSRLLRQPDRLARIGVTWGHLMRLSGWILVGSCAVVMGIPAVAGGLTLIAVLASPILGLAFIALIGVLFDS